TTSGHPQTPDSCSGIGEVGAEPGKPFSAQRVMKSVNRRPDGTEQRVESIEFVARDGFGRIRLEQRGPTKPAGDSGEVIADAAEGKATTKDVPGSEITIYDFPHGKMVWLQPDRRI